MEPMIEILLVGVGGYGVNYVRELLGPDAPEGVRVAGIADPVARRSDCWEMIEDAGIPVYDTIEEFYAGHRADLAIISSPIHFHAGQVIGCLDRGSHVLCEKPVAPLYGQAQEMLEAERRSGKFAAVGYQLSFSRDVLEMKEDILNGRYGEPVLFKAVHAMRRGAKYYARSSWAGRREVNGIPVYDSPLSNACAHQLHNMLFLLGDGIRTAAGMKLTGARLYRGNPNVENYDIVSVHGETEAGVKIQYQTAHPLASKVGPVSLYRFTKGEIRSQDGGFVGYLEDGTVIDYNQVPKGHRMQKLYDVLNCVRCGISPFCTIETAMPHVAVFNALQEYPVAPVPEGQVRTWEQDGDHFWAVNGLEEKMLEAYEQEKLLIL